MKKNRKRANRSDREEATTFLLNAALVSLFKQEQAEEDEASNLRRALLLLIFIVQDDAAPATQYVIDYLLQEFSPLADYFDDKHRHPLVNNEDVMRIHLDNNRTGLLIRDDFGKQLLAEAIEFVRNAGE
jgi:hypothetical protein